MSSRFESAPQTMDRRFGVFNQPVVQNQGVTWSEFAGPEFGLRPDNVGLD